MGRWFYFVVGFVLGVGAYLLFQQIGLHWLPSMPNPTTKQILVYFNRSEPTDIIQMAVKRTIPITTTMVATAAMEELLKGPTDAEKTTGLTTAISDGTVLNYVRIENGIATVDFNYMFDYQMGGSARVRAIYQQIFKTLTQFPTIKEIRLTINHGQRPANLEP